MADDSRETFNLTNTEWIQSVCGKLFNMMNFGEMCDIFLQGEEVDQIIPVHSCVMSAVSPLIHRFLASEEMNNEDKKQIIVQLESLPASVLEKVVKYIYTGSLMIEMQEIHPVLEAAKALEIETLMNLCLEALKEANVDFSQIDLTAKEIPVKFSKVEPGTFAVKFEPGESTVMKGITTKKEEEEEEVYHETFPAPDPAEELILEEVAHEVELSSGILYQDEDIPYVEETVGDMSGGSCQTIDLDPTIAQLEAEIMKQLGGVVVKRETEDTYVVEIPEKELQRLSSHEEVVVSSSKDDETEQQESFGFRPRTVRDYQRVSPREHRIPMSKSGKKHECLRCGKTFNKRCELELHSTSHRDDFDFTCPICGKAFKYKNSIRLHLKRHGERSYECELCHKKFYTPNDLSQHLAIHAGIRQHECAMCQKSFRKRSDYRWHMLREHQVRIPGVDYSAFTCPKCNQGFQLKCELNSHLKYGHAKEYQCRYCQQIFRLAREHKRHMEQEHPHLIQKSYNCPMCNKGFEKAWKADLHQRMVHHIGEKYHCSYEGCDYIAYRRYDLKDHEKRHLTSKRLARKVQRNTQGSQEKSEVVVEEIQSFDTSDCKLNEMSYQSGSDDLDATMQSTSEHDTSSSEPHMSTSGIKQEEEVRPVNLYRSSIPAKTSSSRQIFCDRCGVVFTYTAFKRHLEKCTSMDE